MWIIFGIFVCLVVIGNLCNNSGQYAYLKKDNGKDPKMVAVSKYHGGFRDVSVKNNPNINFYMFEDKVRVIITVAGNYIQHIDFKPEDILDIRYMNEREITESISLGRIVVFGWLGLAMKKKKEINREYIVLKCRYEGKEADIVMGDDYGNYNQICFNTLNSYITEYKSKTVEV